MPPQKTQKQSGEPLGAHRVRLNDEEFAILNWLRTHPAVAAKYGINGCNGNTRVGTMLMMMLAWMGAVVEWKTTLGATDLPSTVEAGSTAARKTTARGASASFIAMLKPRSGRKPAPQPQPMPHAPPEAAIHRANPRKRGRPRKMRVPLLARLAKSGKRRREFTSRGNLIAAPAAVALVQVRMHAKPRASCLSGRPRLRPPPSDRRVCASCL